MGKKFLVFGNYYCEDEQLLTTINGVNTTEEAFEEFKKSDLSKQVDPQVRIMEVVSEEYFYLD